MPAPRVSVICIYYNAERFIAEAIESVLAQRFRDFELLLVNDGSTDSSPKIARDFEQALPSIVRCVEHEGGANRGMSASRNLGIRQSTGEFVAFIDSDDVWRPAKLAEQVAILDSHPEAAMVCGAVNYWSSWNGGRDRAVVTGEVVDRLSPPPETLLAVYPLGSADAPCPSDVMVRRRAIEAAGGFEEQFTGFYEDMAFFAKVFAAVPVWFSSQLWLDYRQHAGSASSAIDTRAYRAIRRRFLEWLEAYVGERELKSNAAVRRVIERARWDLDHPRAARYLRAARRCQSRLFGRRG